MPHTAHLAAIKVCIEVITAFTQNSFVLKLLEAIGAISKSAHKKSEGKSASYQDAVTAALAREHDDDGEEDDDDGEEDDDDGEEDDDDDEDEDMDGMQGGERKLKSVKKLRSIIRSIRGSPQRRQSWIEEVQASADFKSGKLGKQPLMPILDVKTRWSSTHQMLRRAIDHRKIIDDFVGKHRDLHHFDLTNSDWDAIILVTGWLKSFRTATTLMSTTKRPMLSYTHAIFRGLQAQS
ncbi:hypothetical protein C8R44DRAFT_746776 [Mycena epipterygia]|nr:hypothetical protein C8R44DRAFT_746776 [Mycena epipterygia]